MIYTQISGVSFSKIALGAADFKTKVSKQESFALLDYFTENGGNVIDTGRVYSAWLNGGANASESTIGEWIRDRNARNKLIIATKGGHPPLDNMHQSRINEKELTDDINESLKYLGVDCIDVFYLHRDDKNKSVEEIMPILDRFIKDGKTRFIGASNWTAERIAEANVFAIKNGLTPFSFSEIMWPSVKVNKDAILDDTLVVMDEKEYKRYLEMSLPVMAYSSQAQGFLSQVCNDQPLSDFYKQRYFNAENNRLIEIVKRLSQKTGISPTAIGLNRIIRNQLNGIAIVGGLNVEFLKDSMMAVELSEELLAEIIN